MCFAKVIIINNQLKYVVYRMCSVWWLHIYPVLIGVCVCVCMCGVCGVCLCVCVYVWCVCVCVCGVCGVCLCGVCVCVCVCVCSSLCRVLLIRRFHDNFLSEVPQKCMT
jgi:hypothetical protein